MEARVCVGRIVGAHGIRGMVKLVSFTEDPAAIGRYPVTDRAGTRRLRLALQGRNKAQWLARVEGVETRTDAEALAGTDLFVARADLPALEEEEYYHADLIGLVAELAGGEEAGRVRAVHDFGAGPLLELIDRNRRTLMVPFTRLAVPVVDIAGGRLVVVPPVDAEAAAGVGEGACGEEDEAGGAEGEGRGADDAGDGTDGVDSVDAIDGAGGVDGVEGSHDGEDGAGGHGVATDDARDA